MPKFRTAALILTSILTVQAFANVEVGETATPVSQAESQQSPQPVAPSNALGLAELPESLAPAMPPIEGRGVEDNLIPLRLPGYELRVLDKRKRMLYNIRGAWVEASLPVYFYYPTRPAKNSEAINLLRETYDAVLKLGEKQQWTAAEFRDILVQLDSALTILEDSEKAKD